MHLPLSLPINPKQYQVLNYRLSQSPTLHLHLLSSLCPPDDPHLRTSGGSLCFRDDRRSPRNHPGIGLDNSRLDKQLFYRKVSHPVIPVRLAELVQRSSLYLTHPLACEFELSTNFLQRSRLEAIKPIPRSYHLVVVRVSENGRIRREGGGGIGSPPCLCHHQNMNYCDRMVVQHHTTKSMVFVPRTSTVI